MTGRPAMLTTTAAATALLVLLAGGTPSAATVFRNQVQVSSDAPVKLAQPADTLLGRAQPAVDADARGMFGPVVEWPVIPVHVLLLDNGHLLSFGSPVGVAAQGGLYYDNWNPFAGTGLKTSHSGTPTLKTYNSFCNNIVTLKDGQILMVGGNSDGKTSISTAIFDPPSKNLVAGPNVNMQRWYPTVMRRPDNRILVLGGAKYYDTDAYLKPDVTDGVGIAPEISDGLGAWQKLPGATSAEAFGPKRNRWWYPRAFTNLDGSVFGVTDDQMAQARSRCSAPSRPGMGVSGAAVMYTPGKLLVAGGGQNTNYDKLEANAAATIIDISDGTKPAVETVAPMANKRNWLKLTVLPNGEVLADGGTIVGTEPGNGNAVRGAQGAAAARIRTYHSTTVLMPSGAVLTGGGGIPGPQDNLNVEMYYPPYLFKKVDGKVQWASRVNITSIQGNLTWGGSVSLALSSDRSIAAVNLIKTSEQTHSVNQDQRRIPLKFTQSGAKITAEIPASNALLLPASYLLTVVDDAGVPSPSQIVTFVVGEAGRVTVFEEDQTNDPSNQPPPDVPPGVVFDTVDSAIGLEPVNFIGNRVRHQNDVFKIAPIGAASPAVDRADSTLILRKGLSDAGLVSFESLNFPGSFLTVDNSGGNANDRPVVLRKNDGSAAFAAAATFARRPGNLGQHDTYVLAGSQPPLFLRHQNNVLRAQPMADPANLLFRQDSTFRPRGALAVAAETAPDGWADPAGGAAVALEPANFPGYRVHADAGSAAVKIDADRGRQPCRGPGGRGVCGAGGADGRRRRQGRVARVATAGGAAGNGVSFRLLSDATKFLRHAGGVLHVAANDVTEQFAQDASFVVKAPFAA
ncbi:hypothetical protein DFJ73DRAFT_955869 [Zopfochytrium polystomum]|nr:hypothetical protein DFJ73DRAFT_955869 [Zopfochytrium polystomum]